MGYRYITETGPHQDSHSSKAEYLTIADAPLATPAPPTLLSGSARTWTEDCGRNEREIRNPDNVIVSPGVPGAAHHLHDYVGNTSTTAFSTNESLAAATTTCPHDDLSTYYWPVLRLPTATGNTTAYNEGDGNTGQVLLPDSVSIQFQGNPTSNVVAMPRFLRASSGNAHGYSTGAGTERLQWSCSGARDHVDKKYPRCPSGQQVVRIFDFPSCWNGTTIDSENHRSHNVFPSTTGACPTGTFPIPRLHLEISYSVPPGSNYTIDTFPEEQHSSLADHADFINVMPDTLMTAIVECLNHGSQC